MNSLQVGRGCISLRCTRVLEDAAVICGVNHSWPAKTNPAQLEGSGFLTKESSFAWRNAARLLLPFARYAKKPLVSFVVSSLGTDHKDVTNTHASAASTARRKLATQSPVERGIH